MSAVFKRIAASAALVAGMWAGGGVTWAANDSLPGPGVDTPRRETIPNDDGHIPHLPGPYGHRANGAAVAPDAGISVPRPSSQQRVLNELFARLKRSGDAGESENIATSIRRIWLRSGSDTADLLMSRASKAMGAQKGELAEKLLDRIVALEPEWAEAWNRRATVRFNEFDDVGAMADIAQVLVREPRHFGALSGMGYILERHDMHLAALKVFRKVLELYPRQDEIRKMVDKLAAEIEGRDI